MSDAALRTRPVSTATFAQGATAELLADLRRAVGAAHVVDAPDVDTAGDPYDGIGSQARPAVLVRPADVGEVQAVLATARRHGRPVWTVSRGRNLGYGGSAPRVSGSIVLNLSRMVRVLDVDRELGTALIEPGVSFFDLHEHLAAAGLPLMMSVPDLGWGSIIGNALERGFGYAAHADHAAHICGLEVVLADGTLVRTGMGALPGSGEWNGYRGGFGPDLDGLFLQSNFGIVTKMGVWLMPRPERVVACAAVLRDDAALAPLVDALRPLLLDRTIQSNAIVGNATLLASIRMDRSAFHSGPGAMRPAVLADLHAAAGVGAWTARFAVYGSVGMVDARMAAVRNALADVPSLEFVEYAYPGDAMAADIHPATKAQMGVPALDMLPVVGWRGGRAAHVDLSLIGRPDGAAVRRQLELVRPRVEAAGFEWGGGFALFPRHAIGLSLISYNADDAADNEAAQRVVGDLIDEAAGIGLAPYRTQLALMDKVAGLFSFNDGALAGVHARIKGAMDPAGILSPGKQGIWPATPSQIGSPTVDNGPA